MVSLEDRVAVITGAGRGLGREHALLFASLGAKVVVNDLGGSTDGGGSDASVAAQVAAEINALGGEAIANTDSVSDWDGAGRLVASAVDTYGRLDVLVNNAGILRDKMLVNMTEAEFDSVLNVHLKGTFCATRHAVDHWRARAKAGEGVDAAVINTSSGAGLFNNVGQANYGAAKAAIAAFSQIAAKELARIGVRVNTIAPMARTRLTEQTPGMDVAPPEDASTFDPFDPANISPLVAYLASKGSPFTGGVFHVLAGRIDLMDGWSISSTISRNGAWTVEDLEVEMKQFLTIAADREGRLISEPTDLVALASAALGG